MVFCWHLKVVVVLIMVLIIFVGEVQDLSCRVPADSDAAIRVSQIVQLSRLVQASQNMVTRYSLTLHCASCGHHFYQWHLNHSSLAEKQPVVLCSTRQAIF